MTEFNRGMFLYRGEALGISGSFFSGQGSSVLSTIGGKSFAEIEGFSDPSGAKCEHISTFARGSLNGKTGEYETVVEANIRGFRFKEVCRLDEGWVRMRSHHSQRKTLMPIRVELPTSLKFEFAGFQAVATFHKELIGMETKHDFIEALSKPSFRKEHSGRFFREQANGQCLTVNDEIYTEVAGYLIYSPVMRLEWEGARVEGNSIKGHVLKSASVGTCYVAETYRDSISCRTNLLRFTIGGKNSVRKADGDGNGDLGVGSIGTNGVMIPP